VKKVDFKPRVKERRTGVMDEQSGESEEEEVMGEGRGESEKQELVPVRLTKTQRELIPETSEAYEKEQSVIFREDDVGGQATVTTDK